MQVFKLKKETLYKDHNIRVYEVWDKFATVPHYECYIDSQKAIARYSRISKRDIENYIERYI